ncbi:tetratricopeptide repeat protein [Oleidesulfovibrio alaskensis]|jgi:tetratricopeptide (TPR) repeat protein|uniref:SPOR domain-containing protein n=1 Tax=Oleidesulfovibrio alaskensis TaxID=58180 RepID=UPI001A62329D|nr:tetratricopeptide repeat protein [Oleidesulfovibrio alaskensis]MBL3581686.1 tetratricopeptide repeat protein [Oleidesulfovibrio alaskensis]
MNRLAYIFSIAAAAILLGGCAQGKENNSGRFSLMQRYHSGQPLLAEETGQDTRNNHDNSAEAREHLARGLRFLQQERDELAFEQFSRAASLDPALTQARYQRGLLLHSRGMQQEAMQEMEAVLALEPDHAKAHEASGAIFFTAGLMEEALDMFTKAVSLDAGLENSHAFIAAIRNYRGEHTQALQALQAALALYPASAALHNNAGMTLSMLHRDAEAVPHFRQAISLGAPAAKTWNNMGLALCRMNRLDEALIAFRNAGTEAAAYNNLGYYLFLQNRHREAVVYLEKAMELEPRYYARAAENLKRARLAARFDAAPAAPAAIRQIPAPPVVQPAATPHNRTQSTALPVAVPAVAADTANMPPTAGAVSVADSPAAFVTNAAPQSEDKVWAVHESSWKDAHKAQQRAGELRSMGFDARVATFAIRQHGTWHRVVLGSHQTMEEADARCAALVRQAAFENLRSVRVPATLIPAGTPAAQQL